LLSPAADRIKSRAVPVGNRDFDGRPRIPLSIAAMLAKTPNRKRAIEYLAACGAVPITILEREALAPSSPARPRPAPWPPGTRDKLTRVITPYLWVHPDEDRLAY
jgi:hypothetical protein